MFHCGHLTSVSKSHAQDLHRSRARAVEAHIVGSRTNHLHRLANCLGRQRSRHAIVTIEATAESSTKQICAQHDLVFAAAKRLGYQGHSHRLPLVPGMDFKNAVLLEG